MKKYPMTWLFIIGIINLFGISTAWRITDYFYGVHMPYSLILALYLGLSTILWFFLLFKYWNKAWKQEELTRAKLFEKKLKAEETITLIVKRNVFANISLIFSVFLLWFVFLMYFDYTNLVFNIVRIFGIVWFVYGLLFSCFIYKKKMFFKNGMFTIINTKGTDVVAPNEIVNVKLKIKNPNNDDPRQLFFADIAIELFDGRVLICDNADKVMNLDNKIKIIQKHYN